MTIVLLFTLEQQSMGQHFFRIRADVTVKTKLHTGEQNLTVGTVFYDRNERKILYELSFPEEELILTADTITYRIKNNEIVHRMFSPSLVEFSIFHLALSASLPDYGLKKTQFTIGDVQRDNGLIISTWNPPAHLDEELGKIMISVQDKKLFGVIFFSPGGDLLRKQLFEEYIQKDGLVFPGRIVEISYSDGQESYQIMTFKNLIVDEMDHSHKYSFQLDHL